MTVCRAVLAVCLTLLAIPPLAWAEDGGPPTLLHKRFGIAEGSPSRTSQIAQTRDGFLWFLGEQSNLIRFDGKNFYQFEKSEPVSALAAAPDGDLWVGETSRLLRIPAATLSRFTLSEVVVHTFDEPGVKIIFLRFSKDGVLWLGTYRGLFRYDHGRMAAVGPRSSVRRITEARDGHLLVATHDGLLDVAGSTATPHRLRPEQLGVKDGEVLEALEDSHRTTWYLTLHGLAREADGRLERIPPYGPGGLAAVRIHEDRHGTIWIAKTTGLFRVTSTGLELAAPDLEVMSLFNDRDGNLWVGTWNDGLYRFTEAAVRMFTTADGLPNNSIGTVLEAHDGTIWAGANCGGIARLDGRRFQAVTGRVPDGCAFGLAEDSHHDLWVATPTSGALRYRNGVFEQFSRSEGLPDVEVMHILAARDGSLWFGTRRGGISRFKEGRFRTFTTADGLPANTITRAVQDGDGVIWVGTSEGIARLVHERFETVSLTPKTYAFPIGGDRDGGFYVTYRAGGGNVTRRLDRSGTATSLRLDVASLIETKSGELWIGGSTFARVWPGELSRARPRDEPLDYETFSAEDGLGADAVGGSLYNMTLARDGTILAATPQGVAMFDPRRIPVTRTKPLIYLAGVTIGRTTVHPEQPIVLPPGTGRVEFAFAAVEISAPAKIRMQYRLDGVDAEWLDAGAAPRAIYSTLPPGRHTLRIRATNRSGIWDREGVAFAVTQEPFFYQTNGFAAVVILSALLAIAAAYRLRVRQISLAMRARFDERLAERTRVARELHDTLLQTVQGSRMVADDALADPGDHDRLLRAMGQLSTWLAQAAEEGRAALQALRASATETNTLADALRRAIEECRSNSAADLSFSVKGAVREVHPVARDEIYRIGYEAIRNACVHSRGRRIDVWLEYGHDLALRISDDGVGIDATTIETGKVGHFGLRGMRERAERIQATFTMVSGSAAGTAMTLIVPGRIAYRSA
jgi:signal transduction histidine kinase/ligand-binding sensor domain-containing protein